MIRLIKRYESRKLYDTEESRYVSLEEIAAWVRGGQEVRVIDNATSSDVTAQTLTQVILDEGRKGTAFLPAELLHDLVRMGEQAVSNGVKNVQQGVDRLIGASLERLGPVREARTEMDKLRSRLEELESSLTRLEQEPEPPPKAKSTRKKAAGTARGTKTTAGRRKAAAAKKSS